MRSIITRSAVAVATLAIGSAALAAVPASAATSSGVTRDMVLSAVGGLRSQSSTPEQDRAFRSLVNRACAVDYDGGDDTPYSNANVLEGEGGADGLVVSAEIYNNTKPSGQRYRSCNFVAIATVDTSSVLSGTATLTGEEPFASEAMSAAAAPVLSTSVLSGDVFVTPSVVGSDYRYVRAAAAGSAVKTTTTSTPTKVKDVKTKSEKKAAKKAYSKRLASAKKSYKKALDKAGSNRAKKAAAKKAYRSKRASAKAKYRTAIANFVVIEKTSTTTASTPFTLGARVYVSFD